MMMQMSRRRRQRRRRRRSRRMQMTRRRSRSGRETEAVCTQPYPTRREDQRLANTISFPFVLDVVLNQRRECSWAGRTGNQILHL